MRRFMRYGKQFNEINIPQNTFVVGRLYNGVIDIFEFYYGRYEGEIIYL